MKREPYARCKHHVACAAYTGDQPFAFLSYAHLDAEAVYPEIERLDLMGYRIWYDEGIDPGNEWPEEVAGSLKRCTQFIVFVTQRAIGPRNVRNEINYALKLDKPFFAIHLDETELPPGMDLQMSSIQAIFKWRTNEQTYVRNLERALPRTFGSPANGNASGIGASDGGLVELFARTMHSEQQSHMKGAGRTNWHQLDPVDKTQTLTRSRFLLSMLHIAGFSMCAEHKTRITLCTSQETFWTCSRRWNTTGGQENESRLVGATMPKRIKIGVSHRIGSLGRKYQKKSGYGTVRR